MLLVVVAGVAGCAQAAAGPSATADAPSATIGYCGMDPEPVPCVDRAGDGEPVPTQVGAGYELGGNCGSRFSADRCQALAFAAARQLSKTFDEITTVDIVPNPSPPPGGIDFQHRTFLTVGLRTGGSAPVVVACPGIDEAFIPECMPEPVVPVGGVDPGGYGDTPEGATPLPSLDPAAVAQARPLRIPELVVAAAATGPHNIRLGTALLPNGYLTESTIALADPWPSSVLFNGSVEMVVRPSGGGDPLRNKFENGWHPGTFQVDVTLSFDIAWFEPGATFTIVDVVVR